MISNNEIQTLLSRLAFDLDVAPVQFINGPRVEDKPRVQMEHSIVETENIGLRKGSVCQKGIWIFKVITDLNILANPALEIAEQIAPTYDFGVAVPLPLSNAVLRFMRSPMFQDGYPTEASYCLPVSCHYIVTDK